MKLDLFPVLCRSKFPRFLQQRQKKSDVRLSSLCPLPYSYTHSSGTSWIQNSLVILENLQQPNQRHTGCRATQLLREFSSRLPKHHLFFLFHQNQMQKLRKDFTHRKMKRKGKKKRNYKLDYPPTKLRTEYLTFFLQLPSVWSYTLHFKTEALNFREKE